ncbi:Maf family protein [Lichenifustis flavocetrariae]|uniref:Nucleoside triphosphate pyrophosphatase n=1 Tax=Lichenifustis flavocetrariae TaxID=2949735 RepID=A0AA41Z5S3_9HYPH|nr:Maf family protein [Lichenifustis flavocetrariae]MCW6511018.1 Maf family protein [Lichenifustis flavocetrariae]
MSSRFWLADAPLVLASGSATRRVLLEGAGLPVTVRPADLDERAIEAPLRAAREAPSVVAAHLARAKAMTVAKSHPGQLVLGADQVLALGEDLFAKPTSSEAARAHLVRLSGKTHTLSSAVCLVRDDAVLFDTVAEARLTMRSLSEPFLDAYLAAEGSAVCASVGAYRLEGLGIQLFTRIEGDHATVLGLPLLDLLPALRQLGYLLG